MQTFHEHLLSILAEECCEVGQRVMKIERFGLDEVQPGQTLTNRQRLSTEVNQLMAMVDSLHALGILPDAGNRVEMYDKHQKVLDMTKRAVETGALQPPPEGGYKLPLLKLFALRTEEPTRAVSICGNTLPG